jgi:hypothetical protein
MAAVVGVFFSKPDEVTVKNVSTSGPSIVSGVNHAPVTINNSK